MWTAIAEDLNIPWRAVEDMHWVIGQEDMVNLAGGRLLHPDKSGGKQSPSGSRMPPVLPPSVGPPSMKAQFVSTPMSTFSRNPSQAGAMSGEPLSLATTNGVAQARFVSSGENTGFGFQRTHRRQSGTGGQLPSLAELERGIPAYAAQGRDRYREEDKVEKTEEMEEEGGRGQK